MGDVTKRRHASTDPETVRATVCDKLRDIVVALAPEGASAEVLGALPPADKKVLLEALDKWATWARCTKAAETINVNEGERTPAEARRLVTQMFQRARDEAPATEADGGSAPDTTH